MTAQQHLHVSSLRMEPRGQSGSNSPTSGAHRRCHRDSERKRAVVTRLLQDLPNLKSLRLTLTEGEVLIVDRAAITLVRTLGRRLSLRIQAIEEVGVVRQNVARDLLTTAEFAKLMHALSDRP
jgi:hypothetical protein